MINPFFTYSAKICSIILIFLILASCSLAPTGGQSITPQGTTTQTPPTPESVGYATAGPPLLGPMPFPTPDKEPVAWSQLINQDLLAGVEWTQSQGKLVGIQPNEPWSYSFQVPKDWQINQDPNLIFVSVQNEVKTEGAIQEPFAKFEVVRLKEPPGLPEGSIFIPSDFKTVTMMGNSAVLYTRIEQPDQLINFTIVFQHEEAWLVASGYIFLPEPNENEILKYQSILLTMASSFKFID
jgi:hypothetical protein